MHATAMYKMVEDLSDKGDISYGLLAIPNLIIDVDHCGRMTRIYSGSDHWYKGETLMQDVAEEFTGRKVTPETMDQLSSEMGIAFHKCFRPKKKWSPPCTDSQVDTED